MTLYLTLIMLVSAILHATWHTILKVQDDRHFILALGSGLNALLAAPVLFFIPAPDVSLLPVMALATFCHSFYGFFLMKAYQHGDFNQIYPLIRGLGPILIAAASYVLWGETLSPSAIAGIFIISGAILIIASPARILKRHVSNRALFYAFITALLVMTKTLADAAGVKATLESYTYIVYIMVFGVLPYSLFYIVRDRAKIPALSFKAIRFIIIAALSGFISYVLALYAFGLGAVGPVASLRETGIIAAAIIGTLFLKEPFGRKRLYAAIIVVIGIFCLNL